MKTSEQLTLKLRMNARKAELEPNEREVLGSLLEFQNESAATRAFFRRRAGANTLGVDHKERVALRRGDQSLKDYVRQEQLEYVRGIIEGWSKLPQGAAKDSLARRLGIADLVGQDDLFSARPKISRLIQSSSRSSSSYRDAAHDAAGMPKTDLTLLLDGTVDSQRGYHVGRALIEAVSGHVSSDTVGVGALAAPRATSGFLGRMTNKNFVRMFQMSIRESVIDYVLQMGSGRIEGSTLRYLTAEDVDVIVKDLQQVREAIRSGKISR